MSYDKYEKIKVYGGIVLFGSIHNKTEYMVGPNELGEFWKIKIKNLNC